MAYVETHRGTSATRWEFVFIAMQMNFPHDAARCRNAMVENTTSGLGYNAKQRIPTAGVTLKNRKRSQSDFNILQRQKAVDKILQRNF